MRVGVMGAGAVGCYYGGMLARAGHDVVFIGRASHVEAMIATGLRLQTTTFEQTVPVRASTEAGAVEGVDWLLVCVKSTDTEVVGAQLEPHVPEGTLVLSLQNGLDNAPRLASLLPGRLVRPAVVYVATEMVGPGHVRHHGRGELVVAAGPRAREVVETLEAAGVPVSVVDDVQGALWAKLAANCAWNALSALVDRPYGWLAGSAGVPVLVHDILAECRAVAAADGVALAETLESDVGSLAETMATQRSSTAQDLARGRPSEIDHLNGYVVRRGEELGVPAPVNRVLTELVRLLERARAENA